MDLNGDGILDLLSGSYSRHGAEMAGLFKVFWGSDEGFERPETLLGTDGEPLIVNRNRGNTSIRTGTRPYACDIDDDGDLDLIVGNIRGVFYLFEGLGPGEFSPKSTLLKTKAGKTLHVSGHSDPFLFDWDSDGDLDIVSGSLKGGVFLSLNEGTAKSALFTEFKTVIAPSLHPTAQGVVLASLEQIDSPHKETRVWVDDVNGDGKFDILVGDAIVMATPAEGVAKEDLQPRLRQWNEAVRSTSDARSEMFERLKSASKEEENALRDELTELSGKTKDLFEQRADILKEDKTGFVWVYHQK